jgi:hypothetical protein
MWFFYFMFQIKVMDSRGCFSVDPDKMVTNPKKMMKVGLQIKANLENVTGLIPENVQEFCWHLKLKCTECDEIPDHWQYVTLSEEQPLKVKRIINLGLKFGYSEKTTKFEKIHFKFDTTQ